MEIPLRAGQISVRSDGALPFFWPVSHREMLDVRDTMLTGMISLVRNQDEVTDTLRVLLLFLLNRTMLLYQSHALCRRMAAAGHRPLPGPEARIVPALVAARPIPPGSLVAKPEAGSLSALFVELHRRWHSRRLTGRLGSLLEKLDVARGPVTTEMSELIVRHARTSNQQVQFAHLARWFPDLPEAGQASGCSPGVSDAVLATARAAFRAGGEELEDPLAAYLADLLRQAVGRVQSYLEYLSSGSVKLPPRLWTGTGAAVWNRVMRVAVRRGGGEIIGHDHGSNFGHILSPHKAVSDFDICDRFVTGCSLAPAALPGIVRPELLIDRSYPEIITLPPVQRRTDFRTASGPIRRIMFPSFYYFGERMHFYPALPDLVAVDWHARLASRLSGWGYELVMKDHPESSVGVPGGLRTLGADVQGGRFERVLGAADAVLFDSPLSSTFITALRSGLPMVLASWGRAELTSEARELLGLRCAVVETWLDEQNRVQVDWDELKQALERAPALRDNAFLERYFA